MNKKVVLVTGASSGIGHATAKLFLKEGAIVYGTSRKQEVCALDGIHMLTMDQTDDASVNNAIQTLLAREGRLDILVNNAGMGIAGPVLDMTPDDLKRQFDVNLFGALRVLRAAAPALFKSKGRIINVSSVAGFVAIPFQGAYSASKFALESLTESLRAEIRPLGVTVTLVQPGDTKTDFTKNRAALHHISSAYETRYQASVKRMEKDEQNGMPPEAVARVIIKAAKAKKPHVRYTVGFSYQVVRFIKRFMPDDLVSYLVGKLYA